MPAKPEEITAVYLRERHRFANADGDVIVGDARANGSVNAVVAIKGPADEGELHRDQTYRFYGRWQNYTNRRTGETERQFHFATFTLAQPANRDGVIAYLKSAGAGHYFGLARAKALWETFGEDAVRVMREEPERARESLAKQKLPLAEAAAEAIRAKLIEQQALEDCTIRLNELLAGQGFRKSMPRMLLSRYGNRAAEIVARDPYKMMHFPHCGFKLCDQLYQHLGLPPARLKRQALAAIYAVGEDGGNTWSPRKVAEMGVRSLVAAAELKTDRAIELALRARRLVEIRTRGPRGPIAEDGDFAWLADTEQAGNEADLAELIASATVEPHRWPAVESIRNIDGEQPKVLGRALQGPVAILGGRPGSGKTFTAANLIKALIEMYGEGQIGIGAPTNLAAVRLTEAMAGYGAGVRARTWHSLLGLPDPIKQPGERWRHNERNPFPFKVLVGDETSMKDTDIMAAIFRARARGTLVLLVGDTNQLLPVGHGAPLRDLIAAGLPYGELKEIRRNSGGIVEACSAIADGQPWGPGDNLEIIEIDDPAGQQTEVLRLLARMRDEGLDPVWDSRVIVARNQTRIAFNAAMQAELNRNPEIAGSPFRVADKIVHRENADFPIVGVVADDMETNERGDRVKVSNGELGEVQEIEDKHFIVRVRSPERVVRVPRGACKKNTDGTIKETGCGWDLAYAVTYHSSQGSEFPWAIMVAGKGDGRMGCRELVYTGISRAKERCVLIGRKTTFDGMCRRVALGQRKTFLRERILLEQARMELAGL